VFKTSRVPSCFHFYFFWIKASTRISVGETSQNHQLQTLSRSLPQHVAQHRWSSTNGTQSRMAEPPVRPNHLWLPSVPSPSSTNDGLCNIALKLPDSWVQTYCMLITKIKLNQPCQFTLCTLCMSMNKLAYSLFLAFFLVPVNIYLHRDPILSK